MRFCYDEVANDQILLASVKCIDDSGQSASTKQSASCRLVPTARAEAAELATSRAGDLDRARPRAAGHLRG